MLEQIKLKSVDQQKNKWKSGSWLYLINFHKANEIYKILFE